MTLSLDAPEPVGPRSSGELLSDALELLRAHFRPIYSFALPFCVVDLFLHEAANAFAARGAKLNAGSPELAAVIAMLPSLAAAVALMVMSFVTLQLLHTGVVAVAARAWNRGAPDRRAAWTGVRRSGLRMVATGMLFWMVTGVAAVAGLAVCGIPAGGIALVFGLDATLPIAVGAAGSGFVVIVVVLIWYLYSPILVVEGLWFGGALKRSYELMRSRGLPFLRAPKWRLSVVLLVAFGLSSVLQGLFIAPRWLIASAGGEDGIPALSEMPLWFMVLFGFLEVLTNALVVPFSSVLVTLFYLDLRLRVEGLEPATPDPEGRA